MEVAKAKKSELSKKYASILCKSPKLLGEQSGLVTCEEGELLEADSCRLLVLFRKGGLLTM